MGGFALPPLAFADEKSPGVEQSIRALQRSIDEQRKKIASHELSLEEQARRLAEQRAVLELHARQLEALQASLAGRAPASAAAGKTGAREAKGREQTKARPRTATAKAKATPRGVNAYSLGLAGGPAAVAPAAGPP
ncbi:MAG: hypothetical protein ACREGL_03935, partial [Alphaproteobacteria bacterium]